jgi:hypothetical protein
MDIRNLKPIGTTCVGCHEQTNVLLEGWTPDGPMQAQQWSCPRCRAAHTILTQGRVVGTAIGSVQVVSGKAPAPDVRANARAAEA